MVKSYFAKWPIADIWFLINISFSVDVLHVKVYIFWNLIKFVFKLSNFNFHDILFKYQIYDKNFYRHLLSLYF